MLGCPVVYKAHLLNQSGAEITAAAPVDIGRSWSVSTGESVTIPWYQECVQLLDAGETLYFRSFPLPEGVARPGILSVELTAEYEAGALFVVDSEGTRHSLPQISSCAS